MEVEGGIGADCRSYSDEGGRGRYRFVLAMMADTAGPKAVVARCSYRFQCFDECRLIGSITNGDDQDEKARRREGKKVRR